MEPPVPMTDPDPGTRIQVPTTGRWWVQPLAAENRLLLALLHPGLRWVGLKFDHAQARALADKILQNLPGPPEQKARIGER
jgi:hypothetical protein